MTIPSATRRPSPAPVGSRHGRSRRPDSLRILAAVLSFFNLPTLPRVEAATPAPAAVAGAPASPVPAAGAALFTSNVVARIDLELGREALSRLRRAPREDVQAGVEFEGRPFSKVAVHLKGRVGSFRPLEDKPSFTLRFDKLLPGSTLDGLTKIHLNNSVEDPGYLGAELFQAAGIPAARVGHAWVQLNTRDLGLYVLKEGFTREFLAANFRRPEGTLYEFIPPPAGRTPPSPTGSRLSDWERELGTGPDLRLDLQALEAASTEPDLNLRWKRLQEQVDLDGFLRFLAMEALMAHRDGYGMAGNNFRLYHDPGTERLVFLPHGMDQLFGRADLPVRPAMGGPAARALLEIPEARRRYWAHAAQLFAHHFQLEPLQGRVTRLATRLASGLPPTEGRHIEIEAAALKKRIAQRVEFLSRQFQLGEPHSLAFTNGIASPTGWGPLESREPVHAQPAPDRRLALHLQAGKSTATGWRATVLLDPGRYRFEGRARTAGVEAPAFGKNKGAGLRVAGAPSPAPHQLAGTADWTDLAVTFDVPLPAAPGEPVPVDLICQLRAVHGEAWFDLASLRLVRLR